jgi:WD40 repeat protein
LIFYYLNLEDSTIVSCGELIYHTSAINYMVLETSQHKVISAGQRGTLIAFDYSNGAIVSQQPKTATGCSALAYDRVDNILFWGSSDSSVSFLDAAKKPPVAFHKLTFPHHNPQKTGRFAVRCLLYSEDRRILYASCANTVYIIRVTGAAAETRSTIWRQVSLHEGVEITAISTFNRGQFLVSCESRGGVAVFDLSENVVAADATSEETKSQSVALATVKTPTWELVIKESDSNIRTWLEEKGEDTSEVRQRRDLIARVAKVAGVDANAVADALLPVAPRCDIIFSWRWNGVQINSISFIEETESLLFGGSDGQVRIVSFYEFSCSLSGGDEEYQQTLRSELMNLTLSPNGVRGPTGTQRARGFEVAYLTR